MVLEVFKYIWEENIQSITPVVAVFMLLMVWLCIMLYYKIQEEDRANFLTILLFLYFVMILYLNPFLG